MGAARDVRRPERGQVYRLRADGASTAAVVVSNDLRNATLPTVLVARVTTAPKPSVPTIVALPVGEPMVGRVVCDSLAEVHTKDLQKPVGALSRAVMRRIDAGLRAALALDGDA